MKRIFAIITIVFAFNSVVPISISEAGDQLMLEPMWRRAADLNGEKGSVETVEFSSDGEYLLSAGFEPHIFITRSSNFSLAHTSSHSGPSEYLDFSPNGAVLASAHEDGTVRLWLWVSENPSINHQEHVKLRKRQAAAAALRKEQGDH